MVAQLLQPDEPSKLEGGEGSLLSFISVPVEEMIKNNYRLDASAYSGDGRQAREVLSRCKWEVCSLGQIIENAFYGFRSKRVYVGKNNNIAVGFVGSAEMLSVQPKPEKFLLGNRHTTRFSVKKGQILLSRSGTVGNVIFVNDTLEKYFVSEHAIRINCKENSGYVYAFLKSKTGRALVESNIFGAVISQFEPDHLNSVPIPNPPRFVRQEIHDLIDKSFRLRDESNELMDESQTMLKNALRLPDIETLQANAEYFDKKAGVSNYSTPLSELDNRLDASYHIPVVRAIEKHLHKNAKEVTYIGDDRITQAVILPGRFRRVYVQEGQGVVFFGGKQIYELDPGNKKYLSRGRHSGEVWDALKGVITESGV